MSFIDDSEKNIEEYNSSSEDKDKSTLSLKEFTGGSVAGFVGRSGMYIDDLFAGGFHPDSGHGSKNKELLLKQLKDRRKKRKDLETDTDGVIDDFTGIPDPVGGYYNSNDAIINPAYDELDSINQANINFNNYMTPLQDFNWEEIKTDIKYDDNSYDNPVVRDIKYDDNSYDNPVVRDIEYDDDLDYYADDTYVNMSATNMEYIKKDLGYDKTDINVSKYIDVEYDKIDAAMERDRRNEILDKNYVKQSEYLNEKELDGIKFIEDNFMEKSENNTGNEINNIELVTDNFIEKSEQNIENEVENIELSIDNFLNRSEINLETIYKKLSTNMRK